MQDAFRHQPMVGWNADQLPDSEEDIDKMVSIEGMLGEESVGRLSKKEVLTLSDPETS